MDKLFTLVLPDDEVVLKTLGKVFPYHLWGYGMIELSRIYLHKEPGIGFLYASIGKLIQEGLVERKKETTIEELVSLYNDLLRFQKVNPADLKVPNSPRPIYRLTDDGYRVKEERYNAAQVPSSAIWVPA